jgi:isopentenyl diphosphate isomerase/L-lactate dehydrogenase-like FMN-dependent dehydrogenase
MEEVAKAASGPLWFQLYHRGYEITQMLVQRAENAGYKAIVLTVDTPLPAPKERDVRNRYANPFPLANFRANADDLAAMSGTDEAPDWRPARVAPLAWKELDWLRSLTSLPLVLKGVRTAEDAHMATECGVDGILVSTHGGRQMDATLSAIESLPEVVEACKGRAEVYLDSGVRRGSDVLKALALGARAVGVGRPLYWGLPVNGAEGVHGMLELLRHELDQVLGYCGQTDVQHLEPHVVTVPYGWGNGTMYPQARG